MSLTNSSTYTIGGTKAEDTTLSIFSDLRIYENESTYIGNNAAPSNIYGVRNTILGYDTCISSKIASNSVVIGSFAAKNLNGINNVIIGADTGRMLNDSVDNIVLGKNTLQRVAKCQGNIVMGSLTGYNISEGDYNVLIGHNVFKSGYSLSIGNTVLGSYCEGSGTYNNLFGNMNHSTGSNNTLLGNKNKTYTSSNVIILGSDNYNRGTNAIIIGNNITNTTNNIMNINNQIIGTTDDQGNNMLFINDNHIIIGNNADTNNIQFKESGIYVNSADTLSVQCKSQFSEDVLCRTNVDILNMLNVRSVCNFDSNIEMSSEGIPFWKIGLTNKSSEGADLSFVSRNKTFFTITDDFRPEILNFTGKHRCKFEGKEHMSDIYIGMIVVSTGEYCNLQDEYEIGIDESIPTVRLSDSPMDPTAFGVICSVEGDDDATRQFNIGNIRFEVDKISSRVVVNSVGEGAILVCDENGPINNGDFLTTSSKKGYAMRQNTNVCMNYTIAKSTCAFDFASKCVNTAFVGCSYKF